MARRKTTPKAGACAPASLDVNAHVDDYFAGAIEAARRHTGRNDIQPAATTEDLIIGLRMPALACAILLQCDVFPLSRVVRFTGKRGTNKSALLYELERWGLAHRGYVSHIEAESKDTPDLRASVLEHRRDWLEERTMWHPADNQQAWQEGIHWWTKFVNEKQHVVTGWKYPLIVGVDSFTAAASQDELKKIDKVGHAERGYASEALLNARFFPSLPPLVRGKPILIAGTSHGVTGTDAMGRPEFRVKGGQAMTFYETFEIRLTKIAGNKTATGGWNYLELRTDKNSLGADAVKIRARFNWGFEPDPDGVSGVRQVSAWDWHGATIEALADLKKNQKGMWNDVNQIVDLHLTDTGRRGWSKALGVASSAAASWTELGRLLDGRTDLVEALYVPLRIRRRTPYVPGIPFADQIAKGKAAMQALAGDLPYGDPAAPAQFEGYDRELEARTRDDQARPEPDADETEYEDYDED